MDLIPHAKGSSILRVLSGVYHDGSIRVHKIGSFLYCQKDDISLAVISPCQLKTH